MVETFQLQICCAKNTRWRIFTIFRIGLGGRRVRIAPQRKNKLFKLSFTRQIDTQNKVRQTVAVQGTGNGPDQTMMAAPGGR